PGLRGAQSLRLRPGQLARDATPDIHLRTALGVQSAACGQQRTCAVCRAWAGRSRDAGFSAAWHTDLAFDVAQLRAASRRGLSLIAIARMGNGAAWRRGSLLRSGQRTGVERRECVIPVARRACVDRYRLPAHVRFGRSAKDGYRSPLWPTLCL